MGCPEETHRGGVTGHSDVPAGNVQAKMETVACQQMSVAVGADLWAKQKGLFLRSLNLRLHMCWKFSVTDSKVLMQLYGQIADPYKPDHKPAHNIYWKVNREHVMRMDETQAPVEISVFVVCWWIYWNAKNRMLRSHNMANEQMIFVDVVKELGSMQGILGPVQTALVFHVCPVRILDWMLSNTTSTRDYEKSVLPVVIPPDPCQVCPRIQITSSRTTASSSLPLR